MQARTRMTRHNEICGQYIVVWSKGELSVLFSSGGNKKHKYSYNNRMKCETSVKHKADQPKIIPEKLKLWCTNRVKRVMLEKQCNREEY